MAELVNRYASALFELSMESGALESHMAQADHVRGVLERGGLMGPLTNPNIPDLPKQELLQSVLSGQISSDLMGFLYLMIAKKREALILPALTAYLHMGNDEIGKTHAQVVSAHALSQEQLSALTAVLSKKLDKEVEADCRVDPDLLGGLYILVDGQIIDRSLRTQLKRLKDELKRGGAK